MQIIPEWIQDPVVYARARAAVLSVFTVPRFYGPASAVRRYGRKHEDLESIQLVRKGDGLAIWDTPWGQLATMETELPGHLAGLLWEFGCDQYLGGSLAVRPGAIVLDVGANIGLFTLQALKAGAGRVIAFEPNPETRKALEWNVATAGAGRTTVIPKGAWNTRATLEMTIDPFRPGRSSVVVPSPEQASYTVAVELAPLDEVVAALGLPRVDFLKMDIEGAELNALDGASDILKRFQPQLSIAVEHTSDRMKNAENVRDAVIRINPRYRCTAGPYTIMPDRRLAPDILYFY